MADLILIKGGNGTVPDLQDRELAYHKTEKALYIGTDKGNVKLCRAGDYETLNAKIHENSLSVNEISDEIDDINKNITSMDGEISSLSEKMTNLLVNPAGIFYAVYGETTSENIVTAYNNGKIVLCKFYDEVSSTEHILYPTSISRRADNIIPTCVFSSLTGVLRVEVYADNSWVVFE